VLLLSPLQEQRPDDVSALYIDTVKYVKSIHRLSKIKYKRITKEYIYNKLLVVAA